MFQINSINPWVWKAHPEVWVLVIAVSLLGFWAVKVIGPKVVDPGQKVVSKRQ